jgi:hypothetical protein
VVKSELCLSMLVYLLGLVFIFSPSLVFISFISPACSCFYFFILGKNLKRIFPSHEAPVDSSGRADAAAAERGDDHRGKDSQPGQECQPTLLKRRASLGCPPRRRQTDLLVNESAPSAAEARALDKGRHRLMTVERRLCPLCTVQWAACHTDEAVRR